MNIGLFHSFLSNLILVVLVLFHSHYLLTLFSTYLRSLGLSTSFPLFLYLLLSVLSTSSMNPHFLFPFQSSSSSYWVSVPRSSLHPFYHPINIIFCLALSLVLPLFSPNFCPLPKWVLLSSLHNQAVPSSDPSSYLCPLTVFIFFSSIISFSSDSRLIIVPFASKSTPALSESHWKTVENDHQEERQFGLPILTAAMAYSRPEPQPQQDEFFSVSSSPRLRTEKTSKAILHRGLTYLYWGNRNFGGSLAWTCLRQSFIWDGKNSITALNVIFLTAIKVVNKEMKFIKQLKSLQFFFHPRQNSMFY